LFLCWVILDSVRQFPSIYRNRNIALALV
jgi:hypothetical protein